MKRYNPLGAVSRIRASRRAAHRIVSVLGIAAVLWRPALAVAQDGLSPAARNAINLIENRDYDRAITPLERELARSPSSPVLAQYLGMAYFYGAGAINEKELREKAAATMRKALENGGQAQFLVDLSLDKKPKKNLLNVARGNLLINRDEIRFEASRSGQNIVIPKAELTDYRFYDKSSRGVFLLKAGKKDEHYFRPASFTEAEGELLFALIAEYMGVQPE